MRITKKRGQGEPVEKMLSKKELDKIEKKLKEEKKNGNN